MSESPRDVYIIDFASETALSRNDIIDRLRKIKNNHSFIFAKQFKESRHYYEVKVKDGLFSMQGGMLRSLINEPLNVIVDRIDKFFNFELRSDEKVFIPSKFNANIKFKSDGPLHCVEIGGLRSSAMISSRKDLIRFLTESKFTNQIKTRISDALSSKEALEYLRKNDHHSVRLVYQLTKGINNKEVLDVEKEFADLVSGDDFDGDIKDTSSTFGFRRGRCAYLNTISFEKRGHELNVVIDWVTHRQDEEFACDLETAIEKLEAISVCSPEINYKINDERQDLVVLNNMSM